VGYEVKVMPIHASEEGLLLIPQSMETKSAFAFGPCGKFTGRILRLFHLLTGGVFRFSFARKIPHDAFVVFGASCAMDWCRYSKKPTWAFLHSAPLTGPVDFLRPLIVSDMRRSALRCCKIFSVSEAMCKEWREIGIESDVLKMPRPSSRFQKSSDIMRERDLCLFLGRLSYEKGPDRLLEAVRDVPSVKVIFVGDGPMRDALAKDVVRYNLSSRVEFAGWQEDVCKYLSRAGVVVNASRSEGLSLGILEALENGAPIIATDIPGNREALFDGRFGMLVENSVSGIVKGLKDFVAKRITSFPQEDIARELSEITHSSLVRIQEMRWVP
jgi:glycosyltransferase involved in cell wall biosynthesis